MTTSLATKGMIGGKVTHEDWSDDEKAQIRHALGIDGTKVRSINGVLQRAKKVIDAILAAVS